jgi:hypothetical protein
MTSTRDTIHLSLAVIREAVPEPAPPGMLYYFI